MRRRFTQWVVTIALITAISVVSFRMLVTVDKIDRFSLARSQITALEARVNTFGLDVGRLPRHLDELLFGDAISGWKGPYAKDVFLIDAWGRRYEYALLDGGAAFSLRSLGRDGRQGGNGPDTDLEISGTLLPVPTH